MSAFTPDGTKFVSLIPWENNQKENLSRLDERGKIIVWNLTKPFKDWPFNEERINPLFEIGEQENCFVISPDGTAIVSGNNNGEVHFWDLYSGNCFQTFKAHDGAVKGSAYSPDGKFIATAGEDRLVMLWSILSDSTLIPAFSG